MTEIQMTVGAIVALSGAIAFMWRYQIVREKEFGKRQDEDKSQLIKLVADNTKALTEVTGAIENNTEVIKRSIDRKK